MARYDAYLNRTQTILAAARDLRNSLGNPAQIEKAVAQLEQAADEHATQITQAQKFMFEAATAETGDADQATRTTMAAVLAEVQVASVLMTAGEAAGETSTSQKTAPAALDQAIEQLGQSMPAIEATLGSKSPNETLAFSNVATKPLGDAKSDLETTSKEAFTAACDKTLDHLVNSAADTVATVLSKLKDVPAGKISEAIDTLGQHVSAVATTWSLIKRGVNKLISALESLIRLFGEDALKKVKEKAAKLWDDIQSGNFTQKALEVVYGVKDTRARVAKSLTAANLNEESLKAGGRDVAALPARFSDNMGIIKGIVAAVGIGAVVMSFTPLSAYGWSVAAALYAVMLGAVVLLGVDYTDSYDVLDRVRGVGLIADSLHS